MRVMRESGETSNTACTDQYSQERYPPAVYNFTLIINDIHPTSHLSQLAIDKQLIVPFTLIFLFLH